MSDDESASPTDGAIGPAAVLESGAVVGDTRVWSVAERESTADEVRRRLEVGATPEQARDAFLAEHPDERLLGVFVFMDAMDLTHAEARRLVLGDLDLTDQFLDAMVDGIRRGNIDGTYREFDPATGEVVLEVRSNEESGS